MNIELGPNSEAAVAWTPEEAGEAVKRARLIVERSRAPLLNRNSGGDARVGGDLAQVATARADGILEPAPAATNVGKLRKSEKEDGDVPPSILPRLPA